MWGLSLGSIPVLFRLTMSSPGTQPGHSRSGVRLPLALLRLPAMLWGRFLSRWRHSQSLGIPLGVVREGGAARAPVSEAGLGGWRWNC